MQRKVYSRLLEQPHPANLTSLARDLGMHYVSLKQHLQALAKKGYLHFESRGTGRAPLLQLPPQATGVPILGSIPAGPLSEAFQESEGYLPLPGLVQHFALRVSGNSMADLIQHGDVVVFKQGLPERSGEICAVRVEQDEVTLKYVDFIEQQRLRLRPHNPDFPSVEVMASALHIEGVYQGLLRGQVLWALYQEEEL